MPEMAEAFRQAIADTEKEFDMELPKMKPLERLAQLIHTKNSLEKEIACIIGRSALIKHVSEFIDANVLIDTKNSLEKEIACIIGRPVLIGHVGEFIAANVFGIELEQSAAQKGIDGQFAGGALKGRTVDIKYYARIEGLLDISESTLPDFYLVMAGPKALLVSLRGTTRPWLISYVYLLDAKELVSQLKLRGVKIGVATSVARHLWDAAEIYPMQRNNRLILSEDQRKMLALFGEVTIPVYAKEISQGELLQD